MKQYLEQIEELAAVRRIDEDRAARAEIRRRQRRQGRAASRGRRPPREANRALKLSPLWKCADLKMPGNILVVDGRTGPSGSS